MVMEGMLIFNSYVAIVCMVCFNRLQPVTVCCLHYMDMCPIKWFNCLVFSVAPSQAISHVRCFCKADISRTILVSIIRSYRIPDDGDQDGTRNVGLTQTSDTADSLRRLRWICLPQKL